MFAVSPRSRAVRSFNYSAGRCNTAMLKAWNFIRGAHEVLCLAWFISCYTVSTTGEFLNSCVRAVCTEC